MIEQIPGLAEPTIPIDPNDLMSPLFTMIIATVFGAIVALLHLLLIEILPEFLCTLQNWDHQKVCHKTRDL